ncbi:hypothetical protein K461DRAFT_35200 [Myriangium duriaei CBS 260.36]|uniref:Uncharacterized protein n=1 Tax=Myriangium duriaei CBS 260.36 TaxID=1168546 RepID=A0A9P4ITT7_9PEZI|nr:hypothetical protein K461DRAFT_35200 [Myriangium duriaei CBS 260.36]
MRTEQDLLRSHAIIGPDGLLLPAVLQRRRQETNKAAAEISDRLEMVSRKCTSLIRTHDMSRRMVRKKPFISLQPFHVAACKRPRVRPRTWLGRVRCQCKGSIDPSVIFYQKDARSLATRRGLMMHSKNPHIVFAWLHEAQATGECPQPASLVRCLYDSPLNCKGPHSSRIRHNAVVHGLDTRIAPNNVCSNESHRIPVQGDGASQTKSRAFGGYSTGTNRVVYPCRLPRISFALFLRSPATLSPLPELPMPRN